MLIKKPLLRLSEERISLDEIVAHLESPGSGGIAVFLGRPRNTSQTGAELRGLSYEAHLSLAEERLEVVVEHTMSRYPALRDLAIVHRLGGVPIGETAVVVGASSPRRGDAIEACGLLIELVKHVVPIWKAEVALDGSVEWVIRDPASCRTDILDMDILGADLGVTRAR
jgi:molybdopterin synthase catalytic subunit